MFFRKFPKTLGADLVYTVSIPPRRFGRASSRLSHIDVRDAIPFIRDDDGYCVLDGYRNYYPIGSIDNVGDLLEALYRKMSGDTIELSVKGGELVSSEPTGYVGEMEDHIVKLVD